MKKYSKLYEDVPAVINKDISTVKNNNCKDLTTILAIIANNVKICLGELNDRVNTVNSELKSIQIPDKNKEVKAIDTTQSKPEQSKPEQSKPEQPKSTQQTNTQTSTQQTNTQTSTQPK